MAALGLGEMAGGSWLRRFLMRPESLAMLRVLLEIHAFRCRREPRPHRTECTISYGDLCGQAGVPYLTRRPGEFLLEVAEWCEARRFPPINALAVNGETGIPGYNYDQAPGCTFENWEEVADEVIAFRGYPETA